MVARYHLESPAYPEECAANAATIVAIPHDQFPDDEARAELVRRALSGCDVYAYRPAGSPAWVVWVRQEYPFIEARFLPMDWAEEWQAGRVASAEGEEDA